MSSNFQTIFNFTIPSNSETIILREENCIIIQSRDLPANSVINSPIPTPIDSDVIPQLNVVSPVAQADSINNTPTKNNNSTLLRKLCIRRNTIEKCLDVTSEEIKALASLKISNKNRFKRMFDRCTSKMSLKEKINLRQRITRKCEPERYREYSKKYYRNREERMREQEMPNTTL